MFLSKIKKSDFIKKNQTCFEQLKKKKKIFGLQVKKRLDLLLKIK